MRYASGNPPVVIPGRGLGQQGNQKEHSKPATKWNATRQEKLIKHDRAPSHIFHKTEHLFRMSKISDEKQYGKDQEGQVVQSP